MIVLLKEAFTCAMALPTFLRRRAFFFSVEGAVAGVEPEAGVETRPGVCVLIGSLPEDLLVGNRLARTLAAACIAACALPAHGQPAAVPQTPIAVDLLEPVDVLHGHAPQGTLDHEVLLEIARDVGDLVVLEVLGAHAGVDRELLEDLAGDRRTNAVDVLQRDLDALFAGDVDAEETRHVSVTLDLVLTLLALALLVPGIAADHAHDAAAPHDLAVFADASNAGSDLHDGSRWWDGWDGDSCWLCCVDFS